MMYIKLSHHVNRVPSGVVQFSAEYCLNVLCNLSKITRKRNGGVKRVLVRACHCPHFMCGGTKELTEDVFFNYYYFAIS